MKYSDLPAKERPAEKLKFSGTGSMSNAELLSLAIGTDSEDIESGYKILAGLGNGLAALPVMSVPELEDAGFTQTQALRYAAGRELHIRSVTDRAKIPKLDNPARVAAIFSDMLRDEPQERCFVLFINISADLTGYSELAKGSRHQGFLDPLDVYREAAKAGADGIFIVHNHPYNGSGPSEADIAFTKQVADTGKIIRIPLIDHVIVHKGEFCSIRESHGKIFDQNSHYPKNKTQAKGQGQEAWQPEVADASAKAGRPGEMAAYGKAMETFRLNIVYTTFLSTIFLAFSFFQVSEAATTLSRACWLVFIFSFVAAIILNIRMYARQGPYETQNKRKP
jgi:DNA repair protein RadC